MKYTVSKTNFENLRVYQLSEILADEIWNIVISWKYFEKDTVGKQLVKSADSIGSVKFRKKQWTTDNELRTHPIFGVRYPLGI